MDVLADSDPTGFDSTAGQIVLLLAMIAVLVSLIVQYRRRR